MGEEIVSLPVPDDLLAEIFLWLPTPADILRASAACVSFAVSPHIAPLSGDFVSSTPRLYLASLTTECSTPPSHHTPLRRQPVPSLLPPTFPSHSSPPALAPGSSRTAAAAASSSNDLAVSVENPLPIKPRFWCQTFLAPPGDDEDAASAEEMPFRVIWLVLCTTKLFAFVFSSSTGQWRAIPSQRWNNLFAGLLSSGNTVFRFRQYVYGSFYWRTGYAETSMLVLDTRRMEFSIAELPPEAKSSYSLVIAMVEAGKSRPGIFMLKDGGSILSYCTMKNDAGSLGHWQEEKTISLGRGHYLIGSTERYLLLFRLRSSSDGPGFYTLDVKTFHLEKVCDSSTSSFLNLHPYSNFPPSLLSLPTMPRGVENLAEEMLKQGCAASSSA
ncbi:hypothetical protein ACQ4PT_048254 [Festuca glaucescens]